MENPRHEREQELFHACLGLTSLEQSSYLKQACGGDSEFQARIERLLDAHRRAEGLTLGPLSSLSQDDMPDLIGPYRLIGVLGEGGMGTVYEAEQLEPIRRRVALKVVKLGMDTK